MRGVGRGASRGSGAETGVGMAGKSDGRGIEDGARRMDVVLGLGLGLAFRLMFGVEAGVRGRGAGAGENGVRVPVRIVAAVRWVEVVVGVGIR